jgi:N-acetylglucosamine-6-sulfatase
MILSVDLAPTLIDVGGGQPLDKVHGRSFKPILQGKEIDWRNSFHYEYNYEKEFPYTPNVRGVRTREWKYIHYPHGDGSPDQHRAELYNLKDDPLEMHNLIDEPKHKDIVADLKKELTRLQKETAGPPDRMPVDAGIKNVPPKY